jgi:signal transduction histidine kinase
VARKRRDAVASGITVLVVDDQPEVLTSVQLLLEREGHRVLLAESGAEALRLFRAEHVDLLLVDYFMPRMTGEQLVAEIRKLDHEVQIILQTGYSGEKPPRDMLRELEIQGYHDKTEGPDRLLLWVDVALKAHAQMRKLREAEALKSQILTNVSHEFRTPLHIVLGYTEVLQAESTPEAGQTLDRIRHSAQTLLDLVNDFLNLTDLDMGRMQTDAAPLPAAALADEIVRLASRLGDSGAPAIDCQLPETLPALLVDQGKLQIILRTLLSNAIKFAGPGAIAVRATCDDGHHVLLTIRDQGPGIDAEHHERIFEPFFQVDGGPTRHRDGAGVGLTIARRLARLMGGDILVDSRLGEGATFSVILPSAAAEAGAPAGAAVA